MSVDILCKCSHPGRRVWSWHRWHLHSLLANPTFKQVLWCCVSFVSCSIPKSILIPHFCHLKLETRGTHEIIVCFCGWWLDPAMYDSGFLQNLVWNRILTQYFHGSNWHTVTLMTVSLSGWPVYQGCAKRGKFTRFCDSTMWVPRRRREPSKNATFGAFDDGDSVDLGVATRVKVQRCIFHSMRHDITPPTNLIWRACAQQRDELAAYRNRKNTW